jgi:hypothetical protein
MVKITTEESSKSSGYSEGEAGSINITEGASDASSQSSAPKLPPRLDSPTRAEIIAIVEKETKNEIGKIRDEYREVLQQQQEKVFVVLAILTAVLAFIATEASLLKIDKSETIVSISLISTGGLILFSYILLSVLRSEDKKDFLKIFWTSIGMIVAGIILTGWSPKEMIHNLSDSMTKHSNQEVRTSNKEEIKGVNYKK